MTTKREHVEVLRELLRSELEHSGKGYPLVEARIAALEAAISSLTAQSAAEPVAYGDGEGYVHNVPDKCDRIIWRGHYYHLTFHSRPEMIGPVPVEPAEDHIADADKMVPQPATHPTGRPDKVGERICGCGKPAEYEATLGGWACNKYARCPATPAGDGLRIGQTRHYGGDDWFRELTIGGVTFLAPLDQQDEARHVLAKLHPAPGAAPAGVRDEVLRQIAREMRSRYAAAGNPLSGPSHDTIAGHAVDVAAMLARWAERINAATGERHEQ